LRASPEDQEAGQLKLAAHQLKKLLTLTTLGSTCEILILVSLTRSL
jgi:hypothetical protein